MAGKERVVSASLKTKPGPGGPGAALQRQGRHAPQDGRAGIGEGLSAWSDSEDQPQRLRRRRRPREDCETRPPCDRPEHTRFRAHVVAAAGAGVTV
jgi:hypothetical protein